MAFWIYVTFVGTVEILLVWSVLDCRVNVPES